MSDAAFRTRVDTTIGAGRSAFARTCWGRVLAIRDADPAVARAILDELATAYWRPVYKFIRVAWRRDNEDAKDLAQEFFATVFRPEFVARADPSRGRFRSFVLASLKNFLRDRDKLDRSLKRGGDAAFVPLADVASESEFTRTWAESLLEDALAQLERELPRPFRVFREYCVDAPSYRELAARTGLSVSQVTNDLFAARRRLRLIIEARVARTVASGDDVEEELRALFA